MHEIMEDRNPFEMNEEEWNKYAAYLMEFHYRWLFIQILAIFNHISKTENLFHRDLRLREFKFSGLLGVK